MQSEGLDQLKDKQWLRKGNQVEPLLEKIWQGEGPDKMPTIRLDWSNDRHHEIVIHGRGNVVNVFEALISLARLVGKDPNLIAPFIRGAEIQKTLHHDAGAFARCSYCGRYSDKQAALFKDDYPCDCGKPRGWSGSFKAPTADSIWSEA